MNYTVISVQTEDQTLIVQNMPKLASGGSDEVKISVEFDPMWDGLEKTAVFYRKMGAVYHVAIDENNEVVVPYEVMKTKGAVYFGIFGENEAGAVRTSEVVAFDVVQGAAIENAAGYEPPPDIYEEILAAAKNAELIAQSVRDDADAGVFDCDDYALTEEDKKEIAGMVEVAEALPNPCALTLNGVSYDGSEAVTIDIEEGSANWSDIADKPFEEVGGDTFIWDGDAEGRVMTFVLAKVADIIPTMDDLANGGEFYAISGGEPSLNDVFTKESCSVLVDGAIAVLGANTQLPAALIVEEEAVGVPLDYFTGDSAAETGLYLFAYGDMAVTNFKINGYKGFAKEKLKADSLPEHTHVWEKLEDKPFGETTVNIGKKMIFDGDAETGVVASNGKLGFKIANNILSADDLASGMVITSVYEGEKYTADVAAADMVFNDDGYVTVPFKINETTSRELYIVPEDNYTVQAEEELVYPTAGIWTLENDFTFSAIVTGYTGFIKNVIKQIDSKYIPRFYYTKAEIDAALGAYITDIDTLLGGEA